MPPTFLHVFPSFVPGGAQIRVARLAQGLAEVMEEAPRHGVMALDRRTEATAIWPAGVPLELVPPPPPGGSVSRTIALRRILATRRPDLLLTYNWGSMDAVLAARTLGLAAHVHHEDGFNADEADGLKMRRNWTRRLALAGSHRLIVPSQTLQTIARERWRLSEGTVSLVPNGIATADFVGVTDGPPAEAALRACLSIPDDAPVIGTVGHLRPVKNHGRLLEAFGCLDEALGAHLVIVGDGPERADIEARRNALACAGRVHLVGHQDPSGPWYGLFDLFVLSSDSEQMPVALLEAMAAGLPVVSTEVGDVRGMVAQDQVPWIFPLHEATGQTLAGAMENLLQRKDLRQKLGAANREKVRRDYDFGTMVSAYARIYGEALVGTPSPHGRS